MALPMMTVRHHFLCDFGETACRFMVVRRRRDVSAEEIAGFSEVPSEGYREGRFFNLSDAAESLRRASRDACRQAGVRAGKVMVNLDDIRLESVRVKGASSLEKGQDGFSQKNIQEAVERARQSVRPSDKHQVYQGVAEYFIDDESYPASPIGIFGKELSVVLQLLLSESSQAQSAYAVFERAGLGVLSAHPSAYAALCGSEFPSETSSVFRLLLARPRACHMIRASMGGAIQDHASLQVAETYDEAVIAEAGQVLKGLDAGKSPVFVTGEAAEDGALSAALSARFNAAIAVPQARFADPRFKASRFTVLAGLLNLCESAKPSTHREPRLNIDLVKTLTLRAKSFVQEYF